MYSWKKELMEDIDDVQVNEIGLKVYPNRPRNLLEVFQKSAVQFGDKTVLINEKQQLTYEEMDLRSTMAAKAFVHQFNIQQGARIALIMKNTIEFCVATIAALKVGAIVVPMNTKLRPNEWQVLIEKAAPSLVIVDDDLLSDINRLNLTIPILKESEFLETTKKDDWTERDFLLPKVDEHDSAFILFTSGTTGQPKGAVLTHFNVIHACINYERCYGLNYSDSTIIAVPIFHGTGLFAQFFPFIYLGGTIVLQKTFEPDVMLSLCQKHGVTHTILVPTIYSIILSNPNYKVFRLKFRVLGSGGAPLPVMLAQRITEWLPGVKLINTYGLTEATSPAIIMPYQMAMKKNGSIGIPSPVTECKIVNPDTLEELPPNEAGELLLKGPLIMKSYWNNPEATDKTLLHGWLRTGDVAAMDDDGFVYIRDRLKDMINRGGEKIYTVEVENVLYNHPKVLEAAVVGMADPLYGEVVKGVIVLKPNKEATEEEIREWCSRFLAKYKIPECVRFQEHLPRNAGGKVIKKELVENC